MRACRPTNFSWIVEGLLAGCAFPSHGGHFQYLVDVGVQHLVTLTEYTPPQHLIPSDLNFHHIPIAEFSAPSLEQIYEVVNILNQAQAVKKGVAVHCYWGRGRTGTILAACLVALNGTKPEDAIREVRRMRPHSIETREQETAVFRFSESLLNKQRQNQDNTANGSHS